MELFFLFTLGTVFGSFFLVLGTRLPKNESILKPGSHCDYCNQELKWYDLIPIISYLVNLGKCKYCKEKLSIIYPVVEIATGLAFISSYLLFGIGYEFFASLLIFSLLIIIFITDFKYYIILDSPLVLTSIGIFALKWYYFGLKSALLALLSGLIMFIIVLVIKLFGDFLFKKESLGGGDIKLSFVLGVILGIRLSLISFILSSFLALPYALGSAYLTEKKEVPFGPFIISAATIVFIYMDKFTNLLDFFFKI
ncbi:MAG: prepilin peptidase [Bacilli bacterium]|nr:prepilin peptidase [Bacilli bacterium]